MSDVTEVRQGKWERLHEAGADYFRCSECEHTAWGRTNFCPNCGAKMKQESEPSE